MFNLRGGCCAEELRQREIQTYNDYVFPSEGCIAEFVVVVFVYAFFFFCICGVQYYLKHGLNVKYGGSAALWLGRLS